MVEGFFPSAPGEGDTVDLCQEEHHAVGLSKVIAWFREYCCLDPLRLKTTQFME